MLEHLYLEEILKNSQKMLEVLFIGTDAIAFVGNDFSSKVNAMLMFVLR